MIKFYADGAVVVDTMAMLDKELDGEHYFEVLVSPFPLLLS